MFPNDLIALLQPTFQINELEHLLQNYFSMKNFLLFIEQPKQNGTILPKAKRIFAEQKPKLLISKIILYLQFFIVNLKMIYHIYKLIIDKNCRNVVLVSVRISEPEQNRFQFRSISERKNTIKIPYSLKNKTTFITRRPRI